MLSACKSLSSPALVLGVDRCAHVCKIPLPRHHYFGKQTPNHRWLNNALPPFLLLPLRAVLAVGFSKSPRIAPSLSPVGRRTQSRCCKSRVVTCPVQSCSSHPKPQISHTYVNLSQTVLNLANTPRSMSHKEPSPEGAQRHPTRAKKSQEMNQQRTHAEPDRPIDLGLRSLHPPPPPPAPVRTTPLSEQHKATYGTKEFGGSISWLCMTFKVFL